MSVQQFCLRWNNHQPNFISVCSSLLHNGTLVDVTLAAEGNQLQAHKIVLSACSSYFQSLFTMNPCQHPIVILKDVQYDHLRTMVDFMYYGEVNVSQDQLPHILKTAEMLKIKGLAEMPTDPANLMRSDSKSVNETVPELMGTGQSTSTQTSNIAGGSGNSNNTGTGLISNSTTGLESTLWSSSESQFHTQQQQQQQQQQHQQHQSQQTPQHQTQPPQHHQQMQQVTQQQQQLHAQLRNSQTQITHQHHQQPQQHHHHQQQQIRRTPSPLVAGTSPAARRKRIRKSSNNGSGERNNSNNQHNTSIETGSTTDAGGIGLSQMDQMSFSGDGGTANASGLSSLAAHSIHTTKLLKETASNDMETHPQDSDSLDDGHGSHVHIQIKPEVDITGIQQSIPLDISEATTPSEHDAPNNAQSAHSESRFTMLMGTEVLIDDTDIQHKLERQQHIQQQQIEHEHEQEEEDEHQHNTMQMGSKRNRILTRQPRVKRDSDSLSSHVSPEPPLATPTSTTDVNICGSDDNGTSEAVSNCRLSGANGNASTNVVNQTRTLFVSTQSHHRRQHHLLTVPPRIERHSSEPAPSLSPTSPNLLTVPQNSPFLVKQHSDPLPPTHHHYDNTSHLTNVTIGSFGINDDGRVTHGRPAINVGTITNPFAPLHRQYSHPLASVSAATNYAANSAPLQPIQHISLPEAIYANTSPPPVGSSQYIVPIQTIQHPTHIEHSGISSPNTSIPIKSKTTEAAAKIPYVTVSAVSSSITNTGSSSTPITSSSGNSNIKTNNNLKHHFVRSLQTNARTSSSSSTTSGIQTSGGSNSSFEFAPLLRVRNEELQRSVSSPQTSREMITLENPRSSHCPVIRPGPALGCNFCWNTIDSHGRILRRKTKYHCPECQTNLCIVPCFQEYHERLNNETTPKTNTTPKPSSSTPTQQTDNRTSRRHYAKTESI